MNASGRKSPAPIDPGFENYRGEKVVGELTWDPSTGTYNIRTENLDGEPTKHSLGMDEVEVLRRAQLTNDELEGIAARESEYRRLADVADAYESQEAVNQFVAAAHQAAQRRK